MRQQTDAEKQFEQEILNDKLDKIQQAGMVQLKPLKEEIEKEQDFARKGLLIERYNHLAKQMGIDDTISIDEHISMAA